MKDYGTDRKPIFLGEREYVAEALIADLEKNGVKFTKENIVFIAKDGTGQTVWLETGNESAGLKHILDSNGQSPGHAADFERAFGVSRLNEINDGSFVVEDLETERLKSL